MAQKIVITKATFNALTETNAKNFIFSSDLNHLKTAVSGSFQQTGNATKTIAHNLGYRPLSIAYYYDNADSTKWFITLSSAPTAGAYRHSVSSRANVSMYCDTTNTYFRITDNTGDTVVVQYEIFFEGDA